jgi:ankyrin repeat protein
MNDGGTPLFIAAQMGHAAIVQILRDSGAVL